LKKVRITITEPWDRVHVILFLAFHRAQNQKRKSHQQCWYLPVWRQPLKSARSSLWHVEWMWVFIASCEKWQGWSEPMTRLKESWQHPSHHLVQSRAICICATRHYTVDKHVLKIKWDNECKSNTW
jgi:hypothetical protein